MCIRDRLKAVRVDTLGLSTFLWLLVVDSQVGGLGEKSRATHHGQGHEQGEARFEERHAFSFSHGLGSLSKLNSFGNPLSGCWEHSVRLLAVPQ